LLPKALEYRLLLEVSLQIPERPKQVKVVPVEQHELWYRHHAVGVLIQLAQRGEAALVRVELPDDVD
jgi:hypothetical protein